MPTPPAAYARWKSTRSVVTRERWLSPSYVAALMIRLRSVSGPIRPGEKASGTLFSRTCSTFSGYPESRAVASVAQGPDRRAHCDELVEHAVQGPATALTRRELAVGPVDVVVQGHLRAG